MANIGDRPCSLERFAAEFDGRRPGWLVRAPGRINLVGEHTDYNGFPVLPIAIKRAIRMAVAPRPDGMVELKNAAASVYGDRRFAIARDIPAFPLGDWGNYVKAAVQSLTLLALDRGRSLEDLRGMSCLVAGDIPPAAGLSSSTALVVAAGLAFCAVNDLALERKAMAELMAQAEHYVGTRGGGMDQAVCLLASEGQALKIDFFPLRAVGVPFPGDYRIVAAHSTVRAAKTGRQRQAYNRRVLECGVGAQLLARRMAVEPPRRLADLVGAPLGMGLPELLESLDRTLRACEVVSLRRAAELLEVDPGRLAESAGGGPTGDDELKVLQRCRHVFSEAARTERGAVCLAEGDVEEFGRLMDESHRSCARDYEISCPELDQLVEVMRDAGALGARLTGAGFGGFAIALAHIGQVEAIRQAVEEGFYAPRGLSPTDNVFVFEPAAGATTTSPAWPAGPPAAS